MSASDAATMQENVVSAARTLLSDLDDARQHYAEAKQVSMVKRIDFAIGATLTLRAAVQDYDKAVGRG